MCEVGHTYCRLQCKEEAYPVQQAMERRMLHSDTYTSSHHKFTWFIDHRLESCGAGK